MRPPNPTAIGGFYDLLGYLAWCRDRPPDAVLALAQALFQRTGGAVAAAGGHLVKTIGDAGLVVFAREDADRAVAAMAALQRDTEAWLAAYPYPDGLRVGLHVGPVACGPVGGPDAERRDVYGATVNRAAVLKARPFALSAELAALLGPDLRARLTPFGDDEFILET